MSPSFGTGSIVFSCRPSLKRKCRHFDEIFITGCTGSCHFDNSQCSQWWKFHQNDNISVSVLSLSDVSVHFLENAWKGWPEIWHAKVSWPPWKAISSLLIFLILVQFWFSEIGQIWSFLAFYWEHMHVRNNWKLSTLVYSEHRQSRIIVGHGLLLFLIVVQFSNFGVRAFFDNALKELPEIWFADVLWSLSELIRFGLHYVDFPNFEPNFDFMKCDTCCVYNYYFHNDLK